MTLHNDCTSESKKGQGIFWEFFIYTLMTTSQKSEGATTSLPKYKSIIPIVVSEKVLKVF